MKEIFYFIRDKDHKPVISVCLLIETESVQARGVAICSDRDTPCSKLHAHQSNGPGIALRRAWKAWKNEKDMYPICRKEVYHIIDATRFGNPTWEDNTFPGISSYKAFYFPSLSLKEQRILAAVNNTLVILKV